MWKRALDIPQTSSRLPGRNIFIFIASLIQLCTRHRAKFRFFYTLNRDWCKRRRNAFGGGGLLSCLGVLEMMEACISRWTTLNVSSILYCSQRHCRFFLKKIPPFCQSCPRHISLIGHLAHGDTQLEQLLIRAEFIEHLFAKVEKQQESESIVRRACTPMQINAGHCH